MVYTPPHCAWYKKFAGPGGFSFSLFFCPFLYGGHVFSEDVPFFILTFIFYLREGENPGRAGAADGDSLFVSV
jgi:hypothetical protein